MPPTHTHKLNIPPPPPIKKIFLSFFGSFLQIWKDLAVNNLFYSHTNEQTIFSPHFIEQTNYCIIRMCVLSICIFQCLTSLSLKALILLVNNTETKGFFSI